MIDAKGNQVKIPELLDYMIDFYKHPKKVLEVVKPIHDWRIANENPEEFSFSPIDFLRNFIPNNLGIKLFGEEII